MLPKSDGLHICLQKRGEHGRVLCTGHELCIIMVIPEGEKAFKEALQHALPSVQSKAYALMQRLAEQGRIHNEELFRNEGDNCWAIKPANKIRLYGWFCNKRKGDFVIGHAVFKNQNKMDPKDKARMELVKKIYESKEYPHHANRSDP